MFFKLKIYYFALGTQPYETHSKASSPTTFTNSIWTATMPLNGHGDLAIVELIFYTPALALALWVAARHGFSKQAGWICLAILPFIRIIGSALLLASEYHPSNGLTEGATALENVGLSPLLLAMLALLKRVFVFHLNILLAHPS